MKLTKRQLKQIIREERKLLENNTPAHLELAEKMLVQVALHFIYKDQNETGHDIYQEVFNRVGGGIIDEEEIAGALDELAEIYGEL